MLTTLRRQLEPMIGLFALAFIVAGLGFLIVREPTRITKAQEQLLALQLDEAMTLYAENCAVCHGAKGDGIGAFPALNNETVRQISYDDLTKVIARGLYNTAMPAWSEDEGGPLSDYQISKLVALIQAGDWNLTAERVESLGLTPTMPFTVEPDAEKLNLVANLPNGEILTQAISLYAEHCIACHGPDGLGTSLAPALQSSTVSKKDSAELNRAIALGIPGTLMSAWQNRLSESEISAFVTLIKEWEQIPAGVLPEPELRVDLSAANLAQGEQLYAANCSRCHGIEGQGTPRGPALNVKSFLTGTSDGAIQQIIRDGINGTAMIGWGDRLTGSEILSIVAYIRNWESTAPEVANPPQMRGGGPPWLQSSRQSSPSEVRGSDNKDSLNRFPNRPPVPQQTKQDMPFSEFLLSNWKTLLLLIGIMALAFLSIYSALSGINEHQGEQT